MAGIISDVGGAGMTPFLSSEEQRGMNGFFIPQRI